jgi:membrane-associated phospholipid phosphatase
MVSKMPFSKLKLKLSSQPIIGLILLIAFFVFADLAEDVWLNEGFSWDAPLILALHATSRPWLDTLFMVITQTAGVWIVVPLLMTAVTLWQQRKIELAVLFLLSFAGAAGLNALLKLLFARPRPQLFPPLVTEHSFSFPSGHTMSAGAFYGLLAILLWHNQRYIKAILAGFWILLVGTSRIYLGAHYPSDVLASLTAGTIWLILVTSFYQKRIANDQEKNA